MIAGITGAFTGIIGYRKASNIKSLDLRLGDILGRLTDEVTLGNLEWGEEPSLKQLTGAILSKREYAPKVSDNKEIPLNKILSEENKMPIDKLLKGNKRKWPSI
jgi:hypothetical protein